MKELKITVTEHRLADELPKGSRPCGPECGPGCGPTCAASPVVTAKAR